MSEDMKLKLQNAKSISSADFDFGNKVGVLSSNMFHALCPVVGVVFMALLLKFIS